MKIRVTRLDALFSKYIRARDQRCVCCDDPVSPHKSSGTTPWCGQIRYRCLQCAHIFGRGQKSVRWYEDNAVTLCFWCHAWMDQHTTEKHAWQARRLGEPRWGLLQVRARTPGKPDQAAIKAWLQQALTP